MHKIEILAPAGGMDSVIAAVRSGADAVYVGEKLFSARVSAKNFDEQELKQAVAYCHIHSVKLYVTLNTLVFDDELESVKQAILSAARADADALIVQNMGVARLARALVPQLALHASTQMSVHTASGVRALYEMGFKRVVLSREMSKEEIAEAAKIPIELEVFVHGALCMSVSGQCYFSAMLGGRSGNRGACAQTCRLPFSVGGRHGGNALSLKDNSLISYLNELEAMGVASAKIEGRMKRPEYVALAVRACREQLDSGLISVKTADSLRRVFSRTGFTDGYYTGNIGQTMFGTRTKSDVTASDEKLFSSIRQEYKDEIKNINVNAEFFAAIGKPPVFKVTDGTHTVTASADEPCQRAVNLSLSREKCMAQLSKTGGTAYSLENINIDLDSDISIPISTLNKLRRTALEELDKKRSLVHNYKINDLALPRFAPYSSQGENAVRTRCPDTRLSSAFKQAQLVFVPLFSDITELERLVAEGFSVGIEVPRGMFSRDKKIADRLKRVKDIGINDVLCHNIGALYLAKSLKMKLHGGFGLNLVNTLDLEWAQEYGLSDVELSFELTFDRINALGGVIDRGIITYGYLPLMLCRNCPNKSAAIDCKTCKNRSKMTDRKGESFWLRCDGYCTEVLNCVPLFIAREEYSKLSTNFHTLRFSVENYVEIVENLQGFNPFSMLKDKITRGLYKRGVK